jgi:hypothetical protein
VFAGVIGGAVLFAGFVIRNAKSIPGLPDFAVGVGGVLLLAVFVWVSGLFRDHNA